MTLLYRFEDPTSGEILVDGTPLPELDIRDWRKRLSLMSQEVRLFNETVESNIAYGDLDAAPEAIRKAAAVAGADDFIRELPDGYATEIGDHGMRLSGGQRQRIALARTILRDPDILLLDEATNALDSESESAIQDALDTYARGRTVVVIAHRLATVADADQVIVLEAGRVVEMRPARDAAAQRRPVRAPARPAVRQDGDAGLGHGVSDRGDRTVGAAAAHRSGSRAGWPRRPGALERPSRGLSHGERDARIRRSPRRRLRRSAPSGSGAG